MTRWRPVLVFVGLAYALAWLVALPLWLDPRHLTSPLLAPLAVVMMYTPAVAAFVALRTEGLGFAQAARRLGLGVPGAASPLIAALLWAIGLVFVMVLGALATSALLGTYAADLTGFSALRALLEKQARGGPLPPIPLSVLAAVSILQAIPLAVLNMLAAIGEETGWRGLLFPRLSELVGVPAASAVTGVVWGCWHAPLVLLGYNYPTGPRWLALLAMSVVCVLLGVAFSWLRERGRTTWAAAYAHGLFNALAASSMLALGDAAHPVDTLRGTIFGWAGWPVAAVVAGILVVSLTRSRRAVTSSTCSSR